MGKKGVFRLLERYCNIGSLNALTNCHLWHIGKWCAALTMNRALQGLQSENSAVQAEKCQQVFRQPAQMAATTAADKSGMAAVFGLQEINLVGNIG